MADSVEWSTPPMRASDADRQRVADLLREHTSEGRLTIEEYDQRVDAAYAAKTVTDLRPLLADLPVRIDEVLPLEPHQQQMARRWDLPAPVQAPSASPDEQRDWHRFALLGGALLLVLVIVTMVVFKGPFPVFPLAIVGFILLGRGGRHRH